MLYTHIFSKLSQKTKSMNITLSRISSNHESTLGFLSIDGQFLCFTLEDEKRNVKVRGETAIPTGTYRITLRDFGGKHQKYLAHYGSQFHKGMLWLRDVPNFQYILIHVGNDDDDTEGCILLGENAIGNKVRDGFVESSRSAYERVYPIIRDALLAEEEVSITVINLSE